MKFVQTLLLALRGKKQTPVEAVLIPAKYETVAEAVVYTPTTASKTSVISAEDNLIFNSEGFPINVDENAHYITKKTLTPSKLYIEPPFLPWSEQQRVSENPNVNFKKIVNTAPQPIPEPQPELLIQPIPEPQSELIIQSAPQPEPAPQPSYSEQIYNTNEVVTNTNNQDNIFVYNGYPIEFKINDGNSKIAINNKGDYTFLFGEEYILRDETGIEICKGCIIKVLNCDTCNREYILTLQEVVLIV